MYPTYTNPGSFLHVLCENLTPEELDNRYGKDRFSVPENIPYYTIKSNGNQEIPKYFNGVFNNRIVFRNGTARVKTLYEKRMCLMRGCYDATPEEDLLKLKNRDLKKILVIRNAAFGDVLIVSPLFKALKNKYPNSVVHFFGKKDTQLVIQHNPYVDAIINPRETELGFFVDGYDEVFDLVQSIENNGYADHLNALDVLFDQLCFIDEKDLPLNERKPLYFISPHEQKQAATILQRFNINPGKDKIAYFQGEGTALARSLAPLTSLMAMRHLIQLGYKIVYATHRPEARNFILLRLKGDKDIWSIEHRSKILPEHIESKEYSRLNEVTGETELFEVHELNDHIFYTKDIIDNTPPRDSFAMMSFASLSVSVDSFYSHLAAALDIPSVIVFTNYHPYTRTRYYDKSIVVTPDYKELTCGPCNGVVSECPITPNKFPKCSDSISIKELIHAINLADQRVYPIYQLHRDKPLVTVKELEAKIKHEISCSFCNSKSYDLWTSKKETIYFKCNDCDSIYSYSLTLQENKNLLEKHKDSPVLNVWKKIPLKFHLEPLKHVFGDEFEKKNWCLLDPYLEEEEIENFKVIKTHHLKEEQSDDRSLLLIHALEKSRHPIDYLLSLAKTISTDNVIAVLSPVVEFMDKNPSGLHMLQPITGLNKNFPSLSVYKKFFSKETGIHKDILNLKIAIPCKEGAIVVFTKV